MVAKDALTEVGRSGLLISNGIVLEEFLPQLRGSQGRRIFREMSDNDPVVGGTLTAFRQIIARLDWHIEVADDASPEDQATADFVQECFDDMTDDWASTLSGILSMNTYGWSLHEIVYKRRNGNSRGTEANSAYDDGRIGWRKWAPRSQESLVKWLMDETGGIQGMKQQTLNDGMLDIPIEKSLLFRLQSANNNPEGRSMLRNSYRPWFFKKRIEEIEAIGIERDLAGLPVIRMHPKYFSPNASTDEKALLQMMTAMVQNIKRNELEGAVFPLQYDEHGNKTIDLELLHTGGTRQFDTDKIIGRYNQQIAMSVLADFLMLGHENVGSQSLGVSKIELWMMAVEAMAKSIASVVNQHAIPRLLALNGMSAENPPELVFGKVENVDLQKLGIFLRDAAFAGVLVPDEGLEDHIRTLSDMPPVDKEAREDQYGVDGDVYGVRPSKPTPPAAALPAAPAGADLPDVPGTSPNNVTSADAGAK